MNLDKVNCIGIIGDRHTAKTNLMFDALFKYKGDKKIYLYGYPKKFKGFGQVNSLNELSTITNSIIAMDELQKHIKVYDKATNCMFIELLSTMAHQGNVIVFTTQLTQFITKALDGFIDGFLYTRISDLAQLKNGSKIKRRLAEFSCPEKNKWSLNLRNGEYVEIIDYNPIGHNGKKSFKNRNIGKDWRIETLKKS